MTITAKIMDVLSKSEEWVYDKTCKDGRRLHKQRLQKAKSKRLAQLHRVLVDNWKDSDLRHNLFCACRKCNPSITSYHRKLKS